MTAFGAKQPFIRKRDLVVDNERVENYPVSNRQRDRKPCQSAQARAGPFVKGHSRNIGYGMKNTPYRLN